LKDVGDYFSSHIQEPTLMNDPIPTRTLNTHIGVDVVTSEKVTGVNSEMHPANTAVMIVIMIIGNVNNAMICTGSTILLRCLM
jgi:hypothetical protein